MTTATSDYRPIDEPTASPISDWSVKPLWPLLALMLAGPWLAWPWFAFNAIATGSPTKVKEIAACVAGLLLPVLLLFLVTLGHESGLYSLAVARYLAIAVSVARLGVGYYVYNEQSRTFALHEYFGGRVRNGFGVFLAGMLLARRIPHDALPGVWSLLLQ